MPESTPAAGPALDALIAEHVMDFAVFRSEVDVPDGWQHLPGETRWPMYSSGTFCFSVPAYSTDIAAVWQVVEKLRELDYDVTVTARPGLTYGCRVAPREEFNTPSVRFRDGDTAAEAICRAALAALRALGREEDGDAGDGESDHD